MTPGKRALLSICIGVVAGSLCYDLLKATKSNGDFWLSLNVARHLVHGTDPYNRPAAPDDVPYPLTAALLALPFSFLPDPLPSGIFLGLSSGLLAWLLVGDKPWKLLSLLSWPFVYALMFVQWTPLMTCLWFLPILAPLVLVKPQIALPMLLTAKPNWRGLAITLALGLLSLLQLRHLDLLAELLQVPQLASLSRRLLVGGLLYELCLDLLHVGVLLDHLSEVVLRTGEGDAFFDELSAADAYGLEGLRVEGELALQVVGNIGDGVGGWGGGEDGLVEGEGSGWEGDAR